MEAPPITVSDLLHARALLEGHVRLTPAVCLDSPTFQAHLPPDTRVSLKLELLQATGSFKARGAVLSLLQTPRSQWERGVTAVSAGNHAIAVAYAANRMGVRARVVMTSSANPLRRRAAEAYGAEVILAGSIAEAFARVEQIASEEGLFFIHPFEGRNIALGTGTLGLEFLDQVGDLDAVIVPIGGGGLAAGVGTALRLLRPDLRVYGVEPTGADSMARSFEAGKPTALPGPVATIADSLGAPYALPYSYGLCRQALRQVVRVSDEELSQAMAVMMEEGRLCVEPAGAAALAGLLGPLRSELAGAHVGLIVCGTNIDRRSFVAKLPV
jgi:threonine dehydratase